jgi:glycosyltransferase involved in cell wall biosynthesis
LVRQDVIRDYWARPEKTVVMPIGNYDGVFPVACSRSETLVRLGLPEESKTLLCFGMVRPYKGLELALDALRLLGGAYQLIIAGLPLDQRYGEELRARAADQPNVRLVLERVERQRLADLIGAADCVLLPYRRITGSAALLTSLTLGRGVVASDLPFFREILAGETQAGVLFTPGDPKELARAIEEFFGTSAEIRHNAARRLADRYNWDHMVRPVVDWLERTFPGRVRDSKVAAGHFPGK